MAFCDQCGNQLKENAKFCAKCGANAAGATAGLVCGNCGKQLDEEEAFCSECGAKAGEAQTGVDLASAQNQSAFLTEPVQENKSQPYLSNTETVNNMGKKLGGGLIMSGIYDNCEITVVETNTGLNLVVGGKFIANEMVLVWPISIKEIFNIKYDFYSGKKTIQVYAKAGFLGLVGKVKICVDGNYVGGDNI